MKCMFYLVDKINLQKLISTVKEEIHQKTKAFINCHDFFNINSDISQHILQT